MITRAELAEKAKGLGFNLYQAEKDYLQHQFLHALYSKTATDFVFKGGTCLQKTMGLDRFSEDLDFTWRGKNALPTVEGHFSMLDEFKPVTSRKKQDERSVSFKVQLQGPLYNGQPKSIQHLTLEISVREEPLLDPNACRVVPPYDEIRPYTVYAMDSREILAEKIRAIMTRNKARDVYDAWFLLQKGIRTDLDSVNRKLDYYRDVFSPKDFEASVQSKAKLWDSELGILLVHTPAFDPISKQVSGSVLSMLKDGV